MLGLVALAFLAVIATFEDAGAKVRVRATLRAPNVVVHFGTASSCRCNNCTIRHMPIRKQIVYKVNQRDRLVAVRLARYTGVPSRDLLQLRRNGYSWFEIGRFLDLSRPAVRAAMNQVTWKRFLQHQSWIARHGGQGQRGHRVVYYDD
jgi:hypothetical protein